MVSGVARSEDDEMIRQDWDLTRMYAPRSLDDVGRLKVFVKSRGDRPDVSEV